MNNIVLEKDYLIRVLDTISSEYQLVYCSKFISNPVLGNLLPKWMGYIMSHNRFTRHRMVILMTLSVVADHFTYSSILKLFKSLS